MEYQYKSTPGGLLPDLFFLLQQSGFAWSGYWIFIPDRRLPDRTSDEPPKFRIVGFRELRARLWAADRRAFTLTDGVTGV
jgi:hypothetical protein